MSSSIIKPITLKQLIAGLLASLMMFSVMIKEGKFGKVEIALKDEVTTASENIVVELKSYSLKKIDSSASVIEINKNGKWEEVVREEIYHDATVPRVMFLKTGLEVIPVNQLSGGKLEAGEYRITTMIFIGNEKAQPYTINFTVTEASGEAVTNPAA